MKTDERMLNTNKTIAHIRNWLKTYCEQAGMAGFVVGISGGIDSAVTSTLCAQTGLEVLALNLPIYQAKKQIDLSNQHIAWLQATYGQVKNRTVELSNAFKILEQTLPEKIQDDLTMANTRSRLRMLTLFAFANHHRLLVAGTGNKVEDFGVGFFTKYGDGGVDLAPIADLMKSEVYALAETLEISKAIIQAPPTDGLWDDDRTDEAQIGASYAELEWAMAHDKNTSNASVLSDRQKEVLAIYRRFNRANRHKVTPIPICKIPDSYRLTAEIPLKG